MFMKKKPSRITTANFRQWFKALENLYPLFKLELNASIFSILFLCFCCGRKINRNFRSHHVTYLSLWCKQWLKRMSPNAWLSMLAPVSIAPACGWVISCSINFKSWSSFSCNTKLSANKKKFDKMKTSRACETSFICKGYYRVWHTHGSHTHTHRDVFLNHLHISVCVMHKILAHKKLKMICRKVDVVFTMEQVKKQHQHY